MIETLAKLLANLEGPEWGDLNQDIKSLLQQKLTALNDVLTQSKQSEAKDIFDDIEREIFPSLTSEQQTEIHEAIAEAIAPESPSSLRELHWKEKRLIVEQQALHTYFVTEWNRYVETMRSANKSRPPITAFISYAWPSYRYPHEQWTQLFIKQLALDLRAVGINASMDVLDSRFGTNCVRFMQDGVNNSDYIVVVLTESFTYKISNPHCYVKFEYDQIKARIARQTTGSKEKTVIPILISGTVMPIGLGVDLRPIIIHEFATNSTITDPNGGYLINLIGLVNTLYYSREIATLCPPTAQQAIRMRPATQLSDTHLSETMTNWLYHLLRINPLAFPQEYKFIQETFLNPQINFHYYSRQKLINIPRANPFFVETHDTSGTTNLLTLRQRLFTRNTVTVANPNPTRTPHAAISGLGGVGKTQLAIAYMHRYRNLYDLVYWIPADSKGAIIDAYCNLLRQMGDDGNFQSREDIIRRFKVKINDYAQHWLLVYDNVEDAEELTVGDESLLPDIQAEQGHIIITSRSHNWSSCLTIGVFNLEEALHYLYCVVYQNQEYTPPENIAESARELITTLGSLPLALAQAAAYIRREYEEERKKNEDVFAKYLHEFASSLSQLLHQRLFADDHSKAIVATTWNTTMERLKQKNNFITQLIQCAAFLAPDDIPAWLLENISGYTSDEVTAGLTLLDQYSLVTFNQETQMVSIHRLVQTTINMQRVEAAHHALRLTGDERTDAITIRQLKESMKKEPDMQVDLLRKTMNLSFSLKKEKSRKSEQAEQEYYSKLRSVVPHCSAMITNCYKHIIQATNLTHEHTSKIVAEIAEIFRGRNHEIGLQFGSLMELMGKTSTQLQHYYDANSWEGVEAKARHALCLPTEQAIPIQEELLELIRQNRVIRHKDRRLIINTSDVTIAIKLSLAENYIATKNFFQAQELLEEVQASPLNSDRTISLKQLWSKFYLAQNQLSLAEPHLKDLCSIFHGKNKHGDLARTMYRLAIVNIYQRQPEEAIRLITKAEQIISTYFSFEGTTFIPLLAQMLLLLFLLHCNRKDYHQAVLSIQKLDTLNTRYHNTVIKCDKALINTIFRTETELTSHIKDVLDLCFQRGDIEMFCFILYKISLKLIDKKFIASYLNDFSIRLKILNLWQQSRANYAQKNVVAAIKNLEEIIDLYTPTGALTGALYSDLAVLHYTQGNITTAQHYFTTALELSPTDSTTNAEYALFLYQQQKFDEMREHCLTAIQHTQEIDTLVYGALEIFRLDAYLNKERVNSPEQTLTIRPDVLSYYLLIKYYILENPCSKTANQYVNEFAHLIDSINNALSYRILGQIYTLLADEENAELCYAKALSIPANLYEPSPIPASDPTPATSSSAVSRMRSDSDAYAAAAAAPSYSLEEARQRQEAEADDLSAATAQSLLESREDSLVAARAGQAAAVELLAAPRQSRSTRPPSPPSPTLYALAAPRLTLYSRPIGDAPSPSSPPRPSYP